MHNAPSASTVLRRYRVAVLRLVAIYCWAATGAFQTALAAETAGSNAETAEWFEREIRPLLAEHCLSCHTSGLEAPKANLKLDRRDYVLAGGDSGPAIEVGKPDESLLMQAVRGEGLQMPPEKPLSKIDQAKLERWIRIGAPWPEAEAATPASGPDWLVARSRSHWAWQPMRWLAVPAVQDTSWPARPLDSFIRHELEQLELTPAGSASHTSLLRRLAFDLTGLPPSPEEAAQFTSTADPDEAYERLVERYLASPAFGATWGRHWLDLVRYSETLGHEFDYPVRHAWRYRDAVVDALNDDVSYARFVTEHLAGDLVAQPRRHPMSGVNQSLAMTGWWWMGEGLHAPVDVWGDEATRLDNQIDVYSKAFLGLTIACARCHDHKFDAISAADYTSLVGILQSTRRTYAFDDAHGTIAAHNRELEKQTEQLTDKVIANWQANPASVAEYQSWTEQVVARLRESLDESRKVLAIDHPLYPLLVLAESPTPEALTGRHATASAQIAAAAAAFDKWQTDSVLVADFSKGLPEGWYVEAADKRVGGHADQPSGWMLLDPAGPLPARSGIFASHELGKAQQLSLRSPTFPLTHRVVAMRMRGKSAQSMVVVDNYFMNEFQGLLFGDMRKPIDQPHDWGWVVHAGDLNKYLQHPTYLSIEDDENSWFELSEVRLSNQAPPPRPHPTAIRLLTGEESSPDSDLSASKLTHQFASLLHAAAQAVTSDRAAEDPSQADCSRDCSPLESTELLRAAWIEGERLQLPLPVPRIDRGPLEQLAAKTPVPVRLIATHEGTPRDAALAIRGNPHTRGEIVPRGELQALGGQRFDRPASSGREELAANLTSGQHPLAARVMVNRVWLHLLSQGLVESPDNFGLLGGRPSHLELLDYLSLQFIEHDWSIKWLVREICLSRTYRIASRATPPQLESDPSGRWLSHRKVRRLSAEKLRDAMLAVSGSLDRATGGESITVHLKAQMTGRGRPTQSGPLDGNGRRSVYLEIRRNFLDPLLIAFDQPPPATTVGRRNLSNVPAQALSMLNDPLVHELAQRWSARVCTQHESHAGRIEAMYWSAFSRPPDADELAACMQQLGDDEPRSEEARSRVAELAHVLMCTKEFQYLQ